MNRAVLPPTNIPRSLVRDLWRSKEAGLSRRDLSWLGAAVLSGGVVGPVLLLFGLALTFASEASLLLTLEGKTRQDPLITS